MLNKHLLVPIASQGNTDEPTHALIHLNEEAIGRLQMYVDRTEISANAVQSFISATYRFPMQHVTWLQDEDGKIDYREGNGNVVVDERDERYVVATTLVPPYTHIRDVTMRVDANGYIFLRGADWQHDTVYEAEATFSLEKLQ